MNFNQFEFLFIFLPVVLLLFFNPYLKNRRAEILILSSFLFYSIAGVEHAVILAIDILWVHYFVRSKDIVNVKWKLIVAIIIPILSLIYYKYSTFIINDVLFLDGELKERSFSLFDNVILPSGISFFTFQLVSYSIDRYNGLHKEPASLKEFAIYISFFPQLIAGPIVRYNQVVDSIKSLRLWRINKKDLDIAISLIVFGLAIKVLLADGLGNQIAPLLSSPGDLSTSASIYVLLSYSFQIYFDFYGYSLIAIGLGKLFGFNLPRNFYRPYSSVNPKEFWRRWHVSLSYWLRDYLYMNLGGNKRYKTNIFIVFMLCGLWHGASWAFVAWGAYHAFLVVFYKMNSHVWDKAPKIIQLLLTLFLVSIGWVLFIYDFHDSAIFFRSLLGFGQSEINLVSINQWLLLAAAMLVCYMVDIESFLERKEAVKEQVVYAYTITLASLSILSLMFLESSGTFIYFRF